MYFDPYTIEADLHCHTIASDHAYSTVLEMATYAHKLGLRAIAITDHGPKMEDGAHDWHFGNLRSLPPYIEGVRVLHGAEANIINYEGKLDIWERYQKELDWVIVSMHNPCLKPGTIEQHTEAYLAAAENPYVDVIGHSGSPDFKYDYEKVIPIFGEKGKIVEINSHSFVARRGSAENCITIAKICKKYGVSVVVDSDAHSCFSIGDLKQAANMLSSINFPQELILNRSFDAVAEFIEKKRNRPIK